MSKEVNRMEYRMEYGINGIMMNLNKVRSENVRMEEEGSWMNIGIVEKRVKEICEKGVDRYNSLLIMWNIYVNRMDEVGKMLKKCENYCGMYIMSEIDEIELKIMMKELDEKISKMDWYDEMKRIKE